MGFPETISEAGSSRSLKPFEMVGAVVTDELVRNNIEHLRPWMPWARDELLTLDQREALIQNWERERRDGTDAVYCILDDDIAVGGAGLHLKEAGWEIGYWVDKGHLKRGLASFAARELTSLAFDCASAPAVQIRHLVGNEASRRVAQRLGFTLVGVIEDDCFSDSEPQTIWVWQMTPRRWFGFGS